MEKVKFDTDQIVTMYILLDFSLSMKENRRDVIEGLKMYKERTSKLAREEGISIAVCISKFNHRYFQGEFVEPKDLYIDYEPCGDTAMYNALNESIEYNEKYVKEVINNTKVIPKRAFIIMSDGKENCYPTEDLIKKVKDGIAMLNSANTTTAFVAFGDAITTEIGQELGFQSIVNVKDRSLIRKFLGEDLSRSTIEHSRSATPLGSSFFSKSKYGVGQSEKVSERAKEVIEDRKWLGNIFD